MNEQQAVSGMIIVGPPMAVRAVKFRQEKPSRRGFLRWGCSGKPSKSWSGSERKAQSMLTALQIAARRSDPVD